VPRLQEGVEAGDAEQAQAYDQQPGDGAAAEGDVQRRVEPQRRGLSGPHVGSHRNVHPDEPGCAGQNGSEHEAGGGQHAVVR